MWRTDAAEQLAFDGVFYSYRSPDGLRAFKLWTPPGKGPVRALLLFGNPGGGFGGTPVTRAANGTFWNLQRVRA